MTAWTPPDVPALDAQAMAATRARLDSLTKPPGSLGRIEDLAVALAGIAGRADARFDRRTVFVLAADHGVVAEGVSAFPQAVTAQMVANFLNGGAGINVLARQARAQVVVADLGVASPVAAHPALVSSPIAPGTANMAHGPAMTRDQAIAAIEAGRSLVRTAGEAGLDLAATGEMGIGNTTAASAITAVITGCDPVTVTGRGTGIGDDALAHKRQVIQQALAANQPDASDGLDVLAKVGGFEIGGLAGVILESAARRIPVLIDGFISGAAALIAVAIQPAVRDMLIASHCSAEPGHRHLLQHLGLTPLLDLGLRLGEGTGAALAMHLVDAAVAVRDEMATFAEAQVSGSGQ